MCTRGSRWERSVADWWGQAAKRSVPLRLAGQAAGKRELGRGERKEPSCQGVFSAFPNKNEQQGKTQKEKERAKEKSYKNMIWTFWTFCDFPKLVWTNLKQLNSNQFELIQIWVELQPQCPGVEIWFKTHGKDGKAPILSYAKFEGEGETWWAWKNQTVPLFNSKHAFDFKFKWSSTTDSTFDHHMNLHHLAPCQVWDTKDEAKIHDE